MLRKVFFLALVAFLLSSTSVSAQEDGEEDLAPELDEEPQQPPQMTPEQQEQQQMVRRPPRCVHAAVAAPAASPAAFLSARSRPTTARPPPPPSPPPAAQLQQTLFKYLHSRSSEACQAELQVLQETQGSQQITPECEAELQGVRAAGPPFFPVSPRPPLLLRRALRL
jgi:hypothetical protein